jgi:hypothetical protein
MQLLQTPASISSACHKAGNVFCVCTEIGNFVAACDSGKCTLKPAK